MKVELNDFELGQLSPNQANLLPYLVYKIKDKDKVVISYDEGMEKIRFTQKSIDILKSFYCSLIIK